MDVQLAVTSPAAVDADLLVVGVQGSLADALQRALGASAPALVTWLEARKFDGKAGTAVVVPGLVGAKATSVAVVGLGDGGRNDVATAAGKIGQLARSEKATRVAVDAGPLTPARLRDLVEGVSVGNYFYEVYLPKEQRRAPIATLAVLGALSDGERDAAVHDGLVRAKWQRLVRDLNRLYRRLPALHRGDARAEGFRWLEPDDAERSVFAWIRQGDAGDAPVVVAANLTPVPRPDYRLGFPAPGRWAEVLNTDAAAYGGGNRGNLGAVETDGTAWHGQAQSAPVLLPPLSVVMFVQGEGA